MLKLQDNPPQLPCQFESVSEIPGDWWIAHVKARNEKALAWDLTHMGVDYYLPLISRETYSGGRRRRNLYPVFGSYVFFNGDVQQRYKVLTTNRVANVLKVQDQDQFVREITDIERVVNAGDMLELIEGIPIGRRVEVVKGPFVGTQGMVTGNRPWSAITLTINTLGVGAELKINGDFLEVLDEDEFIQVKARSRA